MEVDLANFRDAAPERFVPELMRGQLAEAEHRARYWWSAALVADRSVLDAGCGLGYGSAILAAAGARRVAGVDRAAAVIEAARAQVPSSVELVSADLAELPFPDGSFDVAVCFEVVEHLEDPEPALAELSRVLTSDGVLVVSTPGGGDELRELLAQQFSNVRLYRQVDWIASAIVDDTAAEASDGAVMQGALLRKLTASEPGAELFTLALAGHGALPDPPPAASATHLVVLKDWLDRIAAQEQRIREQADELAHVRALLDEPSALFGRLAEAETLLARVPDLERELAETIGERNAAVARLDTVAPDTSELESLREQVRMMAATRVWRLGSRYWAARDRAKRFLRPR